MNELTDIPLPNTADESEFARLVQFARCASVDAQTVALLAAHLADSGVHLIWPETLRTADVASTGGPGSLSTLLPPFVLRTLGYDVVKLSVPGRPAGAIDSLATLPGYRPRLSCEEVRDVIDRCGFAHFLADERFAPLDAALFAYRRRVGAVALPLLAAASLLSKKLAAGVKTVGLDVRVGSHGNFGATRETARDNAKVFCQAARILGMKAVAFIVPRPGPVQPFIGRGESLVALAVAAGIHEVGENIWLASHVRDCYEMARQVARMDGAENVGAQTPHLRPELIRSALEKHLRAQGSSIDAFQSRIAAVVNAPRLRLRAPSSGIVELNLDLVRAALVRIQADATPGCFLDPAGLELLACAGQEVREGDDLALLRCDIESARGDLAGEIERAFTVNAASPRPQCGLEPMEVVRG